MFLDINSMDNDYLRHIYGLEIWYENSFSIYATDIDGNEYKVNKNGGQVKYNGTVIADTCTYRIYC